MDWPLLALTFVLGAGLGFLGGLFGIGGGIFAIPILGIAYGMLEQRAQGTALVMVVPNVVLGLQKYWQRGNLDRRMVLALAIPAFPLTILGAHLATRLPSSGLRIAFAAFALTIGLYVIGNALWRRRGNDAARRPLPWGFATIVGAIGGFVSGIFSVGGALFAVPVLAFFFGLTQATAQGFGLALVAPGTLAGVTTYALAGDVDWPLGIALALGGFCTVSYGVKVAYRLSEFRLRFAFGLLMLASACAMWFVR